jgi:hypothetical protein
VRANQLIAALAAAAALLAVAIGLYLGGSPLEERLLKLDERRVADLASLAAAIDAYWLANDALPQTFDELVRARRLSHVPADPVSGERYEYDAAAPDRYRLCATFDRATRESDPAGFWTHEPGERCFDITLPANGPGAEAR